ncbi:putative monovalent cation/H+ antiporter subunit F [Neobacillus vireti LMG 21834]|uniref:Monovalent cation/H+ antiporter subunit F n=2 Tax=Neobacillus TaxID=2675232 RepID=A0AB94ISD9_9BACI|nr:Na(+)/H(+) antiporter subunit F1 [Neobacillus vireti]ETI69887.1 putative monovalent cation/H+ antiporter subunit F [Neobacillus vireti LMG 21834]KLT18169.1 monovalent cation/H+ antiporter subunit F [Neobacillus vireti]
MFHTAILIAILFIALAMLGFIYRAIKGPTIPDRVIALDALGINLVALTALISIVLDTNAFLEVILLIGIIAFIGTVAFSKFLEKGEVIENDRDR